MCERVEWRDGIYFGFAFRNYSRGKDVSQRNSKLEGITSEYESASMSQLKITGLLCRRLKPWLVLHFYQPIRFKRMSIRPDSDQTTPHKHRTVFLKLHYWSHLHLLQATNSTNRVSHCVDHQPAFYASSSLPSGNLTPPDHLLNLQACISQL